MIAIMNNKTMNANAHTAKSEKTYAFRKGSGVFSTTFRNTVDTSAIRLNNRTHPQIPIIIFFMSLKIIPIRFFGRR